MSLIISGSRFIEYKHGGGRKLLLPFPKSNFGEQRKTESDATVLLRTVSELQFFVFIMRKIVRTRI